jgi:MFS family permease
MPVPIRWLSAGIIVNRAGGFVTVFLALILSLRHVPTWKIGLALVITAACAIAGSGLGGFAASRIGSRWTIATSMLGAAVFTAVLIYATAYPLTVLVVGLISVFNRGYVPAAATVIGRLTVPGDRVRRYAAFQLAFNIGSAIGPPIGTFLLTRSLTALLAVDAATSACFALVALRVPPEAELGAVAARKRGRAGPRRRVFQDRRYLTYCVGIVLICMAYGQVTGAFPLTVRDHHYTLELLGILLSANAIAVILFQLPLSYLTSRLPYWIPLTVGGALTCGGFAILLAGASVPLLIASTALWTLGEMIFNPVTPAVAMAMSTDENHAIYQGALSMSRTAGQVIGPSLGVFAFSVRPWLPWAGCAVLGAMVVVLFVSLAGTFEALAEKAPKDMAQTP